MGLPGLPELIVVLAILVLLFGAPKIPKLFGAFGEGIKNFRKGVQSDADPEHPEGKLKDPDDSREQDKAP